MTAVRTAREQDLSAVGDLHVAAIEAFGPEAYDYEAVEAWAATDDQPAERYDLSAGHWVVAERGGDVAAFGHLDPDGGRSSPSTSIPTTPARASAPPSSRRWRGTHAASGSTN